MTISWDIVIIISCLSNQPIFYNNQSIGYRYFYLSIYLSIYIYIYYMEVSWNGGTLKSSTLIWFSINHPAIGVSPLENPFVISLGEQL